MPDFEFTVDTQPMAREISRVSDRVERTAGAVVAMQIAVVAAQAESTDHVCRNVNRGFYSLIRSQISQKMARLKSDVDSNLMQMAQQRKALFAIQKRMERDYHMIASRYQKLFRGLNTNLRSRIFAIDRPTVELVTKDVQSLHNRGCNLTATVPVMQLESLTVSQRLLASHIKSRCRDVIESMRRFLNQLYEQNALADRIMLAEVFDSDAARYSVPIIVHEYTSQTGDGSMVHVTPPVTPFINPSAPNIISTVLERYGEISWKPAGALDPDVVRAFERNVQSSTCSERVRNMTLKLFHGSVPDGIGKGDA
jgi:hypothetical protein